MLRSQHKMFLQIVKWFLYATLIGVLVGAADAAFLYALEAAETNVQKIPLYFCALPVVLILVGFLARKVAPSDTDYSTDAAINKINSYRGLSWISALKSFFLPIITIAAGGSAGKEAPCADVGAGIASTVSKLFRFTVSERRKLMICGVSAGFAGVFGVPISGAIFGLEVLWVGHIFYEVMFPAFIAGITAYQVTQAFGVTYMYSPAAFSPVFTESFFIKVVVAGMIFGLVSLLFIEVLKLFKVFFRFIAYKYGWYWKGFLGGAFLVLIALLLSPVYLGLGMGHTEGLLAGESAGLLGSVIKMITTAITVGAGGVGGLVTPVFFIGAEAGSAISAFFEADAATFAALGVVAVLAGTSNAPLAASIMAVEMFGPEIAPYAAVTCIISFLMTGERSMFTKQKIVFNKGMYFDEEGREAEIPKASRRKRKRAELVHLVRHLIPGKDKK